MFQKSPKINLKRSVSHSACWPHVVGDQVNDLNRRAKGGGVCPLQCRSLRSTGHVSRRFKSMSMFSPNGSDPGARSPSFGDTPIQDGPSRKIEENRVQCSLPASKVPLIGARKGALCLSCPNYCSWRVQTEQDGNSRFVEHC